MNRPTLTILCERHGHILVSSYLTIKKKFLILAQGYIFTDFREERGRKRRETSVGCHPYMLHWGLNP